MEQVRVNIEDYINLYEGGLKLDQIKPLQNQTYRLFKSSNIDIRIVSSRSTLNNFSAFKKIEFFMMGNDYFYMIPVTTIKGTIIGFILRGVTSKSYSTISREFSATDKKVPLMFGFDKSFANYDEQCLKKGGALPIIVCEGSKDCLMLKKLYPYVLANNTSSMGLNATVLRNISDKFLLAYDNDKPGQDGIARDKKLLRNMGCYVDNIRLHNQYKDCADYLDDPAAFKLLASQIKTKLRNLFIG